LLLTRPAAVPAGTVLTRAGGTVSPLPPLFPETNLARDPMPSGKYPISGASNKTAVLSVTVCILSLGKK